MLAARSALPRPWALRAPAAVRPPRRQARVVLPA